MHDATPSTVAKALAINLDPLKYGTIVEIGAGQEVARSFFRAGAAAGTIAVRGPKSGMPFAMVTAKPAVEGDGAPDPVMGMISWLWPSPSSGTEFKSPIV